MIVAADRSSVWKTTRSTLGLGLTGAADDVFLAAALRRVAGFTCPCPASTLSRTLAESLNGLLPGEEFKDLRKRADDTIEQMIVQGDLLELDSVTSVDPLAGKGWLFAAPPAFVPRPGGAAIILGIVPDEPTPLPPELAGRVVHDGHHRTISSDGDEDLPALLRETGLLKLSEDAWLKPPREEGARDYIARHDGLLSRSPSGGAIDGLEILNPATPAKYYRGRWTEPRRFSGTFVGRRPQAYGAPIWGFARLVEGNPTHFLDLPLVGARYRGCDAAWRLQAAIDSEGGHPQQYRVRAAPDGTCEFDFFGPLPSWAERRFYLLGRTSAPVHAMISYRIPDSEAEGMRAFLNSFLWLSEANE